MSTLAGLSATLLRLYIITAHVAASAANMECLSSLHFTAGLLPGFGLGPVGQWAELSQCLFTLGLHPPGALAHRITSRPPCGSAATAHILDALRRGYGELERLRQPFQSITNVSVRVHAWVILSVLYLVRFGPVPSVYNYLNIFDGQRICVDS